MKRWQTKVVKTKMTGRKLRIAVYWQEALKQGGLKQRSRVHIVRRRVMSLTEKS
jgi:ribosomal protein L13